MPPEKNAMQPTTNYHELKDGRLRYLAYEKVGSRPIVLLHATGFGPWLWQPIARELAVNHRVIAPYFCGHRPVDPEHGLAWSLLAGDLIELCRELAIEKPLLVGHSMGATVATLAAAGFEVSGLVLFEPIYLPRLEYRDRAAGTARPLARQARLRRNHWPDREQALAYFRSKALFANFDEEVLMLYLEHGLRPSEQGGFELTCSPADEAAQFLGSLALDPWPLLEGLSCPTLVVEGGASVNRSFMNYSEVTKHLRHGRYCLLEAAGHLIPMEQPAAAVRLIQDFIADLPDGAF